MTECLVLAPRDRRLSLVAVLASAACVGLVIGMTAPLMALFLERRGFSEGFIGINAAVYSAALLLAGPQAPRLARALGLGRSITLALLLSAAVLAVFPHVDGAAALLALRFVLGGATAAVWVLSETWINLLAGEGSRGRILSIYATIWGGGMAAGPLLLGMAGTTGTAPFLLAALLLASGSLPILASRRRMPALPSRHGAGRLVDVVAAAPVAVAAGFLCGFGEGTVSTLFPLYGVANAFSEERIVALASVFAIGALGFQPLAGWLVDTVRGPRLVLIFVMATLACTAGAPLTAEAGAAGWVVMALWGGAIGSFYTIGLTLAVRAVPPGFVAAANATFIMAYTAGFIAGPPLGGVAMQVGPPDALFIAMGLPFLLVVPPLLRAAMRRAGR